MSWLSKHGSSDDPPIARQLRKQRASNARVNDVAARIARLAALENQYYDEAAALAADLAMAGMTAESERVLGDAFAMRDQTKGQYDDDETDHAQDAAP